MSILRRKTTYQFEIEKTGINAQYVSDIGNVYTDIFRYTINGTYNDCINSHSNSDVAADIVNYVVRERRIPNIDKDSVEIFHGVFLC